MVTFLTKKRMHTCTFKGKSIDQLTQPTQPTDDINVVSGGRNAGQIWVE